MTVDPVCGMSINPDKAEWTAEYNGQTYYFCAANCLAAFENDPERYLAGGDTP